MKRCPTPWKTRFATKQRALQSGSHVFLMGLLPLRMRAYRCRCHFWHLTKKGALDREIARLMHHAVAQ